MPLWEQVGEVLTVGAVIVMIVVWASMMVWFVWKVATKQPIEGTPEFRTRELARRDADEDR